MDTEKIRELIEIFNNSGLEKLKMEENGFKISLKKGGRTVIAPPSPVNALEMSETLDFSNMTEIKSPLVGVFYSSPSPDLPPFVTIGSKVKKGDVLCIIEAMKVMNEIVAETDGEVVDICVKNGDIAEYGQVLFKIF